ncbi:polyprenyl synthetase family protein [Salibacterium halotolerans]|uniref:Farnesyl diphosphate synthase n=1 Tax=Salibacterium halotolerans TaxID=1884432 RepID=A0A1I5NQS3_9BACI|nr:farnesyl diphosphate synthase [Salibacterium halotolerans]SFP23591.1 geranylgeranyl diphosphate synthase, type II [Salibacterium halotolerans]
MTLTELKQFMDIHKKEIDERMPSYIERMEGPGTLKEAMVYSVQAGGKRVRPLLMLAAVSAFRPVEEQDYQAACSVEMVHTYSLIHDDLPAMDDDDYRRGMLTNHKVYGEAFAVLSGDGLLSKAFEMISTLTHVGDDRKIRMVMELARSSGLEGMTGGQAADLEGENQTLALHELEYIHDHKTGALLTYAITAGAVLGGAPEEDIKNLKLFARELGLVFQIRDDILDIEGDESEMGKAPGSDEGSNKSTYPSLLSMEGAKEKLVFHAEKAKSFLPGSSSYTSLLNDFVDYVAERIH